MVRATEYKGSCNFQGKLAAESALLILLQGMDLVLKIPLLLLGAYCTHKAAKPPNPPAAPEEQEKYFVDRGLWDKLTMWLATKEPALFRVCIYIIQGIEHH